MSRDRFNMWRREGRPTAPLLVRRPQCPTRPDIPSSATIYRTSASQLVCLPLLAQSKKTEALSALNDLAEVLAWDS